MPTETASVFVSPDGVPRLSINARRGFARLMGADGRFIARIGRICGVGGKVIPGVMEAWQAGAEPSLMHGRAAITWISALAAAAFTAAQGGEIAEFGAAEGEPARPLEAVLQDLLD